MTRGQDFIKSAKCTHGHRSAMSNSAWCDLKKIAQFLNYMICAITPNANAKNK